MRILFILTISFITIFIACKGDNNTGYESLDIEGKWSIEAALRNGKRTTTLKDGYIEFNKEGKLITNILGRKTTSNYELKDNFLNSDGDFLYGFTIDKIVGDTLILSGKMKTFDMAFYLLKSIDSTSLESKNSITQ